MRLNLVSDPGGRSLARAMQQAYQLGYEDAKELNKNGKRIYPRKSGADIAKALTTRALKDHATFLRQSYGAGMWQCKRELGQ